MFLLTKCCDEVAFQSLREQSLMYWSSAVWSRWVCLIVLCIRLIHSLHTCSASLGILTATIEDWERSCSLRIIWLLKLSLNFWILKLSQYSQVYVTILKIINVVWEFSFGKWTSFTHSFIHWRQKLPCEMPRRRYNRSQIQTCEVTWPHQNKWGPRV